MNSQYMALRLAFIKWPWPAGTLQLNKIAAGQIQSNTLSITQNMIALELKLLILWNTEVFQTKR